eukprot:TRINITY_DN7155_c0_g1_i1.p1 TRINITY_DN7155_c0_g1~~TRINITY_DN7155_c0_g1_i1.p1  ORF type:complete len:593 (-),score=123.15 TRINITY_DN7155_c0_g1_i1:168-1946(-)
MWAPQRTRLLYQRCRFTCTIVKTPLSTRTTVEESTRMEMTDTMRGSEEIKSVNTSQEKRRSKTGSDDTRRNPSKRVSKREKNQETLLHKQETKERIEKWVSSEEILRRTVRRMEERKGIESKEGWYTIKPVDFLEDEEKDALAEHKGSVYALLCKVYPEYEWIPWKFHRVPQNFWQDQQNHVKYFNHMAIEKNLTSLNDWYKISLKDFCASGRSLLSSYYGSSYINALKSIYPDHDWKIWKFAATPKGFWGHVVHQRQFFDHLAEFRGFVHERDWYKITKKDIAQEGGGRILAQYQNSPYLALKNIYPEKEWLPWLFFQTPKKFWHELENRRKYFEWLEKELGITSTEEWYQVNWNQERKKYHGGALSTYYNDSLVAALPEIYPDFPWDIQNFRKSPNYYWKDEVKTKEFLERMRAELHIHELDDWYRVSHQQFLEFGGETILRKHGGLFGLISTYYPEHVWDRKKFHWLNKRATQRNLVTKLKQIISECGRDFEVVEEFTREDLKFSDSGATIVLDVFVPELNLAFEYQGIQHYKDTEIFGESTKYSSRDVVKKKVCSNVGITILEIPYWWTGDMSSIRTIVKPFLRREEE